MTFSDKSISPNIADNNLGKISNNSSKQSENSQEYLTSLSEEEMLNQAIALSLSTTTTKDKSQADNVENFNDNKR